MGEVLISVALFLAVWGILEFFSMIMSYDDFGDSAWTTLVIATVLALFTLGLILVEDSADEETDQETHLEAQWDITADGTDDIEDVITTVITETVEYDTNPPVPYLERTVTPEVEVEVKVEVIPERPVPSNKFHIDASRRHYDKDFTYRHETKEICGDTTCVPVSLVQHTDGTYWACKRNWGACYEY